MVNTSLVPETAKNIGEGETAAELDDDMSTGAQVQDVALVHELMPSGALVLPGTAQNIYELMPDGALVPPETAQNIDELMPDGALVLPETAKNIGEGETAAELDDDMSTGAQVQDVALVHELMPSGALVSPGTAQNIYELMPDGALVLPETAKNIGEGET